MQGKEKIFYKILNNGLKIVLKQTDKEVAYVGIMVGAGTRDESETPDSNSGTPGNEDGLAHYVEHTVFKGTEGHTAKQIIASIEGYGGEINAYTTKEETTYYAATPVGRWRQTLRIIGEMVTCPTFPKEETEKEKDVILDEIDSYEDSLGELIYDDFESLVFAGSSLGRRILGTKKSVRHIAAHREIAESWIKTRYTPNRMVVFAQGRMTVEQIEQECSALVRSTSDIPSFCLRSAYALPTINLRNESIESSSSSNGSNSSRFQVIGKHTHQVHAMIGGRAYPLGHERQLTTYLMNNILGGGALNSRLNMSLREKNGLVYSVDSQYAPLSDTGYWSIYFACDRRDKDRCEELVRKELKRMREEKISSAQLKRHLGQLHGQMAIQAENEENNVLSMAKNMLYFGNAPSWQETFAKIEQTTPEQIQETANELFAEEKIFRLFYDKM